MKHLLLPAAVLLGLAACAPAELDMPTDMDADGVLSDVEEEMGTDPANPDSDGDDHLDGDEVAEGSDPLDPDSHPYKGGWTIDSACNETIESTGAEVGD